MDQKISDAPRGESFLAAMVNSSSDAILANDLNSKVTFWNQSAERIFGFTAGEIIGQPLTMLFPSDRHEADAQTIERISRGEAIDHYETIHQRKDGRLIDVSLTVSPIRNLEKAAGSIIVIRDLRERQTAAVASSRLAAIIEGSDDAVISKNLNGIVTSWNPGAERVFGYTEKEMIGEPILKLLPPERLMEEQDILSRLQKGERVDHFQTVRVRKDGARIHVSLTISPIRNAQGIVIGASKIARDITLFREAQEKLQSYASDLEARVRERTKTLEEMLSELESFSYSLSHDMRAPLRAIQSFTEMVLSERGDSLGEYKTHLEKVIAAAMRMDRLILDVLSFSKLSRSEIIVRPIDVERLIHDLISERHDLVSEGARIHIEGHFPKVIGHEASLTQCLTNLIANAVKFVRRGEPAHVQIFAEADGERVRICVKDNGIGVATDVQKKLFTLFNRGGLSTEYVGTGIGLAIVKKAAERMNGNVGVRSLPGHGSTFWIELPKAE